MLLTEWLSSPPYPFRRLCEQDIRGLIESRAGTADASPTPNATVRPILRQLKPHEVDEMVRRYEADPDCSPNHLAAAFSVHRTTVVANLRQRGVIIRRTCPRLSPEDVAEATNLYLEEGWSLAQLSAKYGVSSPTVGRALKKAGVVMRRPGGQPSRTRWRRSPT